MTAQPTPLPLHATLAALPAEWPEDLLPQIRQQVEASGRKIVVLDDDPTGTQTVYDLPILTEWSVPILAEQLARSDVCFYILTNSRSLPLAAAQNLNREIGRNLTQAARQTEREFTVVSRSDSTLRGHYPGEVDALVEVLGRPPDATLIVPFFLEGGRYTLNDIHYVAEGDQLIPAAQTPFAQDKAFGYHASNLREWVVEKSGGRLALDAVTAISIADLRRGGPEVVAARLCTPDAGAVIVVNAASYRDMEVFVSGLLAAEARGRHFVYRTAASFVQVRAGIGPRSLVTAAELGLPAQGGGLVVVGSYVPKSTGQLQVLLEQTEILGLEVRVAALLNPELREQEIDRVGQSMNQALADGQDVAIYTSRELLSASTATSSLETGQQISAGLVQIVQGLTVRPRYLLAKGGITSSDVATQGLGIRRAQVVGQILPGVPIWRTGPESRYEGLAYIVFPGNVGASDAVAQVVQRLAARG